jgi:hypothetical protein
LILNDAPVKVLQPVSLAIKVNSGEYGNYYSYQNSNPNTASTATTEAVFKLLDPVPSISLFYAPTAYSFSGKYAACLNAKEPTDKTEERIKCEAEALLESKFNPIAIGDVNFYAIDVSPYRFWEKDSVTRMTFQLGAIGQKNADYYYISDEILKLDGPWARFEEDTKTNIVTFCGWTANISRPWIHSEAIRFLPRPILIPTTLILSPKPLEYTKWKSTGESIAMPRLNKALKSAAMIIKPLEPPSYITGVISDYYIGNEVKNET